MADESYSFSTARTRLEEIVVQVRKKDTSLEKSLDLLEEGVRLANACTELIDHQDWVAPAAVPEDVGTAAAPEAGAEEPSAEPLADGASADSTSELAVVIVEETIACEDDGTVVAEITEVAQFDPAPDFFDADDAWADESESVIAEGSDDPAASEG